MKEIYYQEICIAVKKVKLLSLEPQGMNTEANIYREAKVETKL